MNKKKISKSEKVIPKEGKANISNVKKRINIQKIKKVKHKISNEMRIQIKLSEEELKDFSLKINQMKQELKKIIIGQEEIIGGLIRALICNGHVILEGVPGIAKTLLIRALGEIMGLNVKRVQFTVDLLPTDIVGLTIYREDTHKFEVIKGPIFTNFLIADEINRAPPKTQSALLESMQEKQVTIGRESFILPDPFFVMATQNPIESSGVYQLPEAQVDRFIFKLFINYPKIAEEKLIMKKNIDSMSFKDFKLKQVISLEDLTKMKLLAEKIHLSEELENYIMKIIDYTRDKKNKYARYLDFGASPRATISFFKASKAEALMNGRGFVVPEDIKKVAFDILRHRLILNYEAEASGLSSDSIIEKILNEISITLE